MTTPTVKIKARNHPILVSLAMRGGDTPDTGLVFRPEPPGDQGRLEMPAVNIDVGVESAELATLADGLGGGTLSKAEVQAVLEESCPHTATSSRPYIYPTTNVWMGLG